MVAAQVGGGTSIHLGRPAQDPRVPAKTTTAELKGASFPFVTETNELDRRYVRAALRAFARGGYFGTTMNHIADEAGVSQPRVSQVFDGKLSAYLAAHDLALSVVMASFDEVHPDRSHFDPAAAGATFLTLLRDRPEVIMIVLHTVTAGSVEPRLADAARAALAKLSDMLVDRFGATPKQAADFLATGFLTMILSSAHIGPDDPANLRAVAAVVPRALARQQ